MYNYFCPPRPTDTDIYHSLYSGIVFPRNDIKNLDVNQTSLSDRGEATGYRISSSMMISSTGWARPQVGMIDYE